MLFSVILCTSLSTIDFFGIYQKVSFEIRSNPISVAATIIYVQTIIVAIFIVPQPLGQSMKLVTNPREIQTENINATKLNQTFKILEPQSFGYNSSNSKILPKIFFSNTRLSLKTSKYKLIFLNSIFFQCHQIPKS